ncbi:MAG TPA: 16S rRNA (cytosine(1402)-N(4))-methyltransferase RsmH [Acidimicrobiia bacterium]|nr:16S rRNA (cytosine(1402)-N(4))-methyltransferase RsmH [Acidimicrobiia bacterium]
MSDFNHVPVMAKEIIEIISQTQVDGVIIDATLGGAGHSKMILEALPNAKLIAFDRDMNAIDEAKKNLDGLLDRVEIIHAGFETIGKKIRERNLEKGVAIVLFDLGVSSHQLDVKERGFTYRHEDAPLDMRMDASEDITAEKIVNEYEQDEIERILRENGDERFARKIAKEIVLARPLKNAGDLVGAIRKAIPHRFQRLGHPAKRTFQALRIEVNRELDQIATALEESVHLLAPGGKILVLSYHSGEDRIAKNTFKKYFHQEKVTQDGRLIPRNDQTSNSGYESSVRLVSVSAQKKPTSAEIASNPRAKSARLRVAQREEFPQASGM